MQCGSRFLPRNANVKCRSFACAYLTLVPCDALPPAPPVQRGTIVTSRPFAAESLRIRSRLSACQRCPDYITSVRDSPYSYFGKHLDERVEPQRPDPVAKAIAPPQWHRSAPQP